MKISTLEERVGRISLAFFNRQRNCQDVCRQELIQAVLQEKERCLSSMEDKIKDLRQRLLIVNICGDRQETL